MKLFYLSIALLVVVAACASSSKNGDEQKSYPNLVHLQEPGDIPNRPAKVYIDSVKQISTDDRPALLISGTFPDGCTNIREIHHKTTDSSLNLDIIAWRNPEQMCTQVLTPFSFIYDKLAEKEIIDRSSVVINDTEYRY